MYIVLDIGGTKTRIASSRNGRSIHKTVICSTPKNFSQAMRSYARHIRELTAENKIQKVAAGFPGVLNLQRTSPLARGNLRGWVGKPLKKSLEKIVSAPVLLENDAALGGLGEATVGAGKGYGIVAYLTISTGFGGSRIVKGRIDAHHYGFEPGKQIIYFKKSTSGRLVPKTIEEFVAGKELLKTHKKRPEKLHDERTWKEIEMLTAFGIHNIIAVWSPEIIVVGGGIGVSGRLNFDRIRTTVQGLYSYMVIPPIKKARLGDINGLHGALAFIRQHSKKR